MVRMVRIGVEHDLRGLRFGRSRPRFDSLMSAPT